MATSKADRERIEKLEAAVSQNENAIFGWSTIGSGRDPRSFRFRDEDHDLRKKIHRAADELKSLDRSARAVLDAPWGVVFGGRPYAAVSGDKQATSIVGRLSKLESKSAPTCDGKGSCATASECKPGRRCVVDFTHNAWRELCSQPDPPLPQPRPEHYVVRCKDSARIPVTGPRHGVVVSKYEPKIGDPYCLIATNRDSIASVNDTVWFTHGTATHLRDDLYSVKVSDIHIVQKGEA